MGKGKGSAQSSVGAGRSLLFCSGRERQGGDRACFRVLMATGVDLNMRNQSR